MTGQEILDRYLTREERGRFMINKHNSSWFYAKDLDEEESQYHIVVYRAFDWALTPEGRKYWVDIGLRLESIQNGGEFPKDEPLYEMTPHKFI